MNCSPKMGASKESNNNSVVFGSDLATGASSDMCLQVLGSSGGLLTNFPSASILACTDWHTEWTVLAALERLAN